MRQQQNRAAQNIPADVVRQPLLLGACARRSWRRCRVPNPGPQTKPSLRSDELFYGGEAGGGKTDLGIGLALTEQKRSLLLKRINKDAVKIKSRIEEILGHDNGYNGQLQRWRLGERQIDIAGCEQESDKQTADGSTTAAMVVRYRLDSAPVIVDVGGGYGGGVTIRLKDNGIEPVSFVGSWQSIEKTKDGQLAFANKRAEVWWKFRRP